MKTLIALLKGIITQRHHGFEPEVLLLQAGDIKKVILGNPYPVAESDPGSLHVGFLFEVPRNPDFKKLDFLFLPVPLLSSNPIQFTGTFE
jgi:hypothetical protein